MENNYNEWEDYVKQVREQQESGTQTSTEQQEIPQEQPQYQQAYGQQTTQREYTDYNRIPTRKHKKTGKIVGIVIAGCLAVALVGSVAFSGATYLRQNIMKHQWSPSDTNDISTEEDIEISIAAPINNGTVVPGDVSPVVEEVMPSIVSISSKVIQTTSDWFGQQYSQESEGSGSGIIFSQDHDHLYIVTNNHVVQDSNEISVKFVDDSVVTAEIKGTDEDSDLAVVIIALDKIKDSTKEAIKIATLGDSDAMKVGQPVIAIGNALGYGQSVTTGIVSAKERDVVLTDKTMKLLQTNAAINPGNSGGALLNANGQVIGINSVKYASSEIEGMGFAIPMAIAKPIMEDLMNERVIPEDQQAGLGIVGLDIDADSAEGYGFPQGVYVREVMKGSAAEKAGIRFGDIITKFDGRDVSGMSSLSNFLSKKASGDQVQIVVMRQNNNGVYKAVKLDVVLQKKVQQDNAQGNSSNENSQSGNNNNSGAGNSGNQMPNNGNMNDMMEFFRQYFGY